jgi:2-phospho-L-lactate transferase/gluconeogenesis factor (CofD/UPF0052 family)
MENREERGVGLAPTEGGRAPASADEVPEDILAEQDAAERQVGGEFQVPPEIQEATEEVLAERDADVKAANEAL